MEAAVKLNAAANFASPKCVDGEGVGTGGDKLAPKSCVSNDDAQNEMQQRFNGSIKSVGNEYGFISCQEAKEKYARDVHFSRDDVSAEKWPPKSKQAVSFSIVINERGRPQAREIELLPEELTEVSATVTRRTPPVQCELQSRIPAPKGHAWADAMDDNDDDDAEIEALRRIGDRVYDVDGECKAVGKGDVGGGDHQNDRRVSEGWKKSGYQANEHTDYGRSWRHSHHGDTQKGRRRLRKNDWDDDVWQTGSDDQGDENGNLSSARRASPIGVAQDSVTSASNLSAGAPVFSMSPMSSVTALTAKESSLSAQAPVFTMANSATFASTASASTLSAQASGFRMTPMLSAPGSITFESGEPQGFTQTALTPQHASADLRFSLSAQTPGTPSQAATSNRCGLSAEAPVWMPGAQSTATYMLASDHSTNNDNSLQVSENGYVSTVHGSDSLVGSTQATELRADAPVWTPLVQAIGNTTETNCVGHCSGETWSGSENFLDSRCVAEGNDCTTTGETAQGSWEETVQYFEGGGMYYDVDGHERAWLDANREAAHPRWKQDSEQAARPRWEQDSEQAKDAAVPSQGEDDKFAEFRSRPEKGLRYGDRGDEGGWKEEAAAEPDWERSWRGGWKDSSKKGFARGNRQEDTAETWTPSSNTWRSGSNSDDGWRESNKTKNGAKKWSQDTAWIEEGEDQDDAESWSRSWKSSVARDRQDDPESWSRAWQSHQGWQRDGNASDKWEASGGSHRGRRGSRAEWRPVDDGAKWSDRGGDEDSTRESEKSTNDTWQTSRSELREVTSEEWTQHASDEGTTTSNGKVDAQAFHKLALGYLRPGTKRNDRDRKLSDSVRERTKS
eukprot:TRINITY_DN29356_c0_g1_i1.p1 TRINITY_DN29356_c0_g1~~TRINITY_DN29356_c0_g1_i1.p1  ORF type:complete len:847 (+),score=142.45 TRINITY_DN29356_c0_g1_i1:92-2632(+)